MSFEQARPHSRKGAWVSFAVRNEGVGRLVASIAFGSDVARHLGVYPGAGRVILELGRLQDEGKLRLIATKPNDREGYSCRKNSARTCSRAISPLANRLEYAGFELPLRRATRCTILDVGRTSKGAAYVVVMLPEWARRPARYTEAVA